MTQAPLSATRESVHGSATGRSALVVAILVEATTLLILLLIAVPLKHLAGWPAGVKIIGPVHGAAVLAAVYLLIEAFAAGEIRMRTALFLMLGALVPFGGYIGSRMLARRQPKKAGLHEERGSESAMKMISSAIREFA